MRIAIASWRGGVQMRIEFLGIMGSKGLILILKRPVAKHQVLNTKYQIPVKTLAAKG